MRQSVLKRSSILKELLAPYRLPLFVTIFFGIISGTATVLMTYYIGLSIDALSLPNSSQPFFLKHYNVSCCVYYWQPLLNGS